MYCIEEDTIREDNFTESLNIINNFMKQKLKSMTKKEIEEIIHIKITKGSNV